MSKLLGKNCIYFVLGLLLVGALGVANGSRTLQAAPMKGWEQVRVLAEGVPLHGANGLFIDDHDQLYVASSFGREILVMNRETGEIQRQFGPEAGINGVDDLVVAPDGLIYMTDFATNEVMRLNPETGELVALAHLPGVNPITMSPNGRLFVGLCFEGDGLYEIDPAGMTPPVPVVENAFGGCLNGMDIGPDGYLYGPRMFLGDIVRVDVDTGAVTVVADGFTFPVAVKFDSQGRLYVNEAVGLFAGGETSGLVWQVDVQTGYKHQLITLPFALDNLALDTADRLFVSSQTTGAIVEIIPEAESGETRVVSPGGMMLPGGIAVLTDPHHPYKQQLYVADFFHVRTFSPRTGVERHTTGAPIGVSSITADGENYIITDQFLGLVQVRQGKTHEVLASYTGFFPVNALRFQGHIIVADLLSQSLVQVNAQNPDERVTIAAGFSVPAGLATDGDNLWASDWATGEIWLIAAEGHILAEPLLIASGLMGPEGLALSKRGHLLVVESGVGRLSVIEPGTGEVLPVVEGLAIGTAAPPNQMPTWVFNGVAVDVFGFVYMTGDQTSVIYKVPPWVVQRAIEGEDYQ